MAASSNGRPGEMIVGINVTPMVDIVLVLLIILMVTASYTVSKAVPVDLPNAESGESVSSEPLAISIDQAGRFYLDGVPVDVEGIRSAVRDKRKQAEPRALIAADGGVAHRHVVRVMDVLRTEGVVQFAINVAPEERAP